MNRLQCQLVCLLSVLCVLCGSAILAAQAPLVGRPADFSGAVGGPFIVTISVEPTEVAVEEPLTLTLRVVGPGNLREIARPPLAKLEAFRPFAVDDLDDPFTVDPTPARTFRYRLRARTAGVYHIPPLKFVYFNPAIVPPSRGYQTTYADPITFHVRPQPAPLLSNVPDWLKEPIVPSPTVGDSTLLSEWIENLLGWLGLHTPMRGPSGPLLWILALATPPALCVAFCYSWQRFLGSHPRSHAAADALRAIRAPGSDAGATISQALLNYLHERADLPRPATTSAEVAEFLATSNVPPRLTQNTNEVLCQLEQFRYAGYRMVGSIADSAERLISAWEASPWQLR
jgi:hypothetical protein